MSVVTTGKPGVVPPRCAMLACVALIAAGSTSAAPRDRGPQIPGRPVHAAAADAHAPSVWTGGPRPPLVLLVVVDQLRADYLSRFGTALLPAGTDAAPGGFHWLTANGAYYPYGEHDLLQAMTGPGHATIATGAWPARNGVPLNAWHDAARGLDVYCVDDPDAPVVGAEGRPVSARVLSTSTIGDELKVADPRARVVSIALKDRSAILLGGKAPDAAVWFDTKSARWVTSRAYAPDGQLPAWLAQLSGTLAPPGTIWTWSAEGHGSGRSAHGRVDGFSDELRLGEKPILASPYGYGLTVDAAAAALDAFDLGRDGSPDLLAVSFSSFDFEGHLTGPQSREMEAMFVELDAALARLLAEVGRRVPLRDVVVALTGDHGAPPLASWNAEQGREAGTVSRAAASSRLEAALTARFGPPAGGRWIASDDDLNFWLAPAALAGQDRAVVEAEAAAALEAVPGVLFAFTASEVRDGRLPPGDLGRRIANQHVPGVSGDVVAVPRPFWYVDDNPVSHMTGWSYDRLVPIFLAGPGVRPGLRAEPAEVVDLAPTLAFLTGVLPPASSEGRVLSEALRTTEVPVPR